MPAAESEIIYAPTEAIVRVALEPAFNAIHSLFLISKSEKLGGLGEWVKKTREVMSPEELARHNLVTIGFYYAILPRRSWPSFEAYVDHLAAMPAMELRDKLLETYMQLPCESEHEAVMVDKKDILASAEDYLAFLGKRFSPEHIDRELEIEAYGYVMEPPAMQALIVNHLRHMWDIYLAEEWARVEPMLKDAVAAFEQIDVGEMSKLEAARFITDHEFDEEWWQEMIERSEAVICVPSAHVGPYLGSFRTDNAAGILFGARLPVGTKFYAPDLSRNEILVRLNALADDSRLRILRLIAEEGEKRSQDIIQQLELSQSAASRHLKQLSANGYLEERRCDGSKCYSANGKRIEDTLQAINSYLTGH